MNIRNLGKLGAATAALLTIPAGCVPAVMAPTVIATPGFGKTPAAFTADHAACAALADQQITPAKTAANNQIVSTALLNAALGAGGSAAVGASNGEVAANALGNGAAAGAVTGQAAQATLQQQYDVAYSACMYAKGNVVPGYGPVVVEAPPPLTEPHKVRRHHKPAAATASAGGSNQTTTGSGSGFVVPAATAPSPGGFVEPPAATASGSAQPAPSTGSFVVPAATR